MARENIKVTIRKPGDFSVSSKIAWTDGVADGLRIPRRYPFVDIANYDDLETAGYFRHGHKNVDTTQFNGSAATNTEGNMGYQLPRTEKLVLLVKKGATGAEEFTFKGSLEYDIPDEVITIPAGAVGDLYEVDLYDMGLLLEGVSGEPGVSLDSVATTLDFALLVRAG